jgi:hypothetical protein
MSDDLMRIARRLEEDASRLASGELDDATAAKLAEEIAKAAAEAAALVERALRDQAPVPRAPGQESLPLGG